MSEIHGCSTSGGYDVIIVGRRNTAPSSGWLPTDLGSSLKAWLDSVDSNTITVTDSRVSAWADRAGGASLTQTTAGNRPVVSTLGGVPTVYFDGSTRYMTRATHGLGTGAQPFTLVWLAAHDESSYGVLLRVDTATSVGTTVGAMSYSGNRVVDLSGAYLNPSPAIASGTSAAMFAVRYSGGSINSGMGLRANGDTRAWTGGSSSSMSFLGVYGLVVGATPTGTFPGKGHLCQLVLVAGALSDADTQKLEGYVAHRCAAAALLPSGHPYKIAPP